MAKIEDNRLMSTSGYNCQVCKDEGGYIVKQYVPFYGREAEVWKKCEACSGGLKNRVDTSRKLSNIPRAFYNSTYDRFDWTIYRDGSGIQINMSKQKKTIDCFVHDFDKWESEGFGLYICSRTKGSGKTFLASCICNSLMNQNAIRARFVSATELLDIAQSGDKSSEDEYKKNPIKKLCDCKLLVLDDIGMKKTGNEWMNEELFKIIDSRMTQGLVTIITSNQKPDELNVDDRIIERIQKMTVVIELPEYNVRSKEAHAKKIEFFRSVGLIENKEGGSNRND